MTQGQGHDPVTREIIKNYLESAADTMAVTVVRTARSLVVRDNMDFSTAIFNADGDQVAQGLTLPFHMGAMQPALDAVRAHFGDDVKPGDVFANNDPYEGASHLPDIFVFKPIFVNDLLMGWTCVIAHQTDIGGRVAGGQRLRQHRDIPGGPAPAAPEAVRGGQAERGRVADHREERPRARQGAGRHTGAAFGAAAGRAGRAPAGRRARPGEPEELHDRHHRLHRAPDAGRDRGAAGRLVGVHRLRGRRRVRPGAHRDQGARDDRGRRDRARLHPARRRRRRGRSTRTWPSPSRRPTRS